MNAKLSNIINGVTTFAAAVTTAVIVIEDETTAGADKKAEAKKELKEWITKLAEENQMPSWLAGLLTSDMILGFAIDKIVDRLNKTGVFDKAFDTLKNI